MEEGFNVSLGESQGLVAGGGGGPILIQMDVGVRFVGPPCVCVLSCDPDPGGFWSTQLSG